MELARLQTEFWLLLGNKLTPATLLISLKSLPLEKNKRKLHVCTSAPAFPSVKVEFARPVFSHFFVVTHDFSNSSPSKFNPRANTANHTDGRIVFPLSLVRTNQQPTKKNLLTCLWFLLPIL